MPTLSVGYEPWPIKLDGVDHEGEPFAFDLTWAHNHGLTATHQLTVSNKASDLTRANLLTVGRTQRIRDAAAVLERVEHAASECPASPTPPGCPPRGKSALVMTC